MSDPYLDGTSDWWHLERPSPELLAARADGWLGSPAVAVDLGCGLGTEASFLAAVGWSAAGVDLSAPALQTAASQQAGATFIRADALALPLRTACADLLLLRACRLAAGVPNDIGPAVIEHVFRGWHIDQLTVEDIPSGTRQMPAVVARLRRP